MLRTINATTCLHPIRSAAELPHSVNGIDFAVPYCGSCAKSREIVAEREAAKREHKRLEDAQDPDGDRQELRQARKRFNRAHLAFIADREWQEQRSMDDHGVSPSHEAVEGSTALDDPSPGKFTTLRPKKNLTVRFDGTEEYRPEEAYRSPASFDRSAPQYEPGLHADDTGNGFLNTSDPYASNTSSELSELSDERSGESSDESMGESGDEKSDESGDQDMEDVSGDAEDEEGDEEVVHVPPRDHPTDDEEEQEQKQEKEGGEQQEGEEEEGEEEDSDCAVLTKEELTERCRVLQERIDELCQRNDQ